MNPNLPCCATSNGSPTRLTSFFRLDLAGFFLSLLMIFSAASVAQAQYTTSPDGAGGVIITGYSGPGGDVVIPERISGLLVTSIGAMSFSSNQTLNSVTIPNSVTSIGTSAFYDCQSLSTVNFGTRVTSIGDYAFYLNNIEFVTIPASVRSIGAEAFYDNSVLRANFEGNAPMMGVAVFGLEYVADPGFKVFYNEGAKGFTSPIWKDSSGDKYPAFALPAE